MIRLKGSVQVRWVEYSVNPQIVALDIVFSFLFAFILFLAYFRFRSALPNIQASSGKQVKRYKRHRLWRHIETLLVLHCTLRLKGKHGAFAALTGEGQQIRSAKYKVLRIFFIRCASPTGGVQIAAPIVLAQHKETIGLEIAC